MLVLGRAERSASRTNQPIYVNEKITPVAAGNCNPTVHTATSHLTKKMLFSSCDYENSSKAESEIRSKSTLVIRCRPNSHTSDMGIENCITVCYDGLPISLCFKQGDVPIYG
jgi:hypothetical protein